MKLSGRIYNVLDEKGAEIYSITPESSVYDAIEMMAERNVGALLVISGKKLCGIISERDYTRKVILKGWVSKKIPVESIMTRKVNKVKADITVEEALSVMTHKRIRHLPVVFNRKLVGVVTIGDLVKWVISEQSATIDQLEHFITGSYPG
jgi:CBS domain-containing protein